MRSTGAWDKYDAALLLETSENVLQNGYALEPELENLSQRLRKKAILAGEIIDDEYRNCDEMIWQHKRIKGILEGDEKESQKASALFKEMAQVYMLDKIAYNKILRQAYKLCGETMPAVKEIRNDVKQLFQKWLKSKETKRLSAERCTELIEEISSYACLRQYCAQEFWEIDDKKIVAEAFEKIKKDKFFWFSHLFSFYLLERSKNLYVLFLTEREEVKVLIEKWDQEDREACISFEEKMKLSTPEEEETVNSDQNAGASFISNRGMGQGETLVAEEEEGEKTIDISQIDLHSTTVDGTAAHGMMDREESCIGEAAAEQIEENAEAESMGEEERNICSLIESKYSTQGFVAGAINYKKIRDYYKSFFAKTLILSDDEIESVLKKNCLAAGKRYYAYSTLLNEDDSRELEAYTEREVESHVYVFYEKIIDRFKNNFGSSMQNATVLKGYMQKKTGKYIYEEECLHKSGPPFGIDYAQNTVDSLLLEEGEPMSVEKIKARLPWLSEKYIDQVLLQDRNIIITDKDFRLHIDLFYFSDEEMEDVAGMIQREIDRNRYMFGKELLDGMQKNLPSLYERIECFGGRGIRNAIAKKLRDRFKFNGNIICAMHDNLDNAAIFKAYATEQGSFTLQALRELREDIGVNAIYFDAVSTVASRINAEEYVSNGSLHFDIDGTDRAIDRLMDGNFCSIAEIDNFIFFPTEKYPWNCYLLESYVANFSCEFQLVHTTYNETKCVGAIVRRDSNLDSMDDVVLAFLHQHKEIESDSQALDALVKCGYIARRRYRDMERLLKKAKSEG